MEARLGIGVIGLGRRWPRYRQALLALHRDARISAVYDPSAARAHEEARELGCDVALGAIDLISRDDVDAVLLVGGAWFGLWPLEQAVRAHKPVLCAGSLVRDDAHADDLARRLGPEAAIHMAPWPTFELLQEAAVQQVLPGLGSPRLVLAGRVTVGEEDVLATTAALVLLWSVAGLFESSPLAVSVQPPGAGRALPAWSSSSPKTASGSSVCGKARSKPGDAGWRSRRTAVLCGPSCRAC
jgi:hypothetical protein